MYELVITEKPAAAKKIAESLADGRVIKESMNGVPYYKLTHKNKDIVVACAVGHLYGLAEKEKKGWVFPVFDIEWKPIFETSKESKFTKKYLDVIKKLCKNADSFTIATDYDQEGEVIGLNVLRFACKQKDANRMKFSTLTKPDLVNSYQNKMPHLDWGQAEAGETRHNLDWINGINYSRALTSAIKSTGAFKIMSTGRVQGPALKIIVDREGEIRAFKPTPFWQIQLTGEYDEQEIIAWHQQTINEKKVKEQAEKIIKDFKGYNIHENKELNQKIAGLLIKKIESLENYIEQAKFLLKEKDNVIDDILKILDKNKKIEFDAAFQELKKTLDTDKFWEKEKANAVFEKTKNEKEAKVENIERKEVNQMPPFPFDLTSLQVEAYRCFNISPKETLDIAQELYTSGLISYPRTSSQQLPAAIGYERILNDLAKNKQYSEFGKLLLKKSRLMPNNGKKTDPAHPAIFPTGIIPKGLKEKEAKIYDLIVKRFLATFAEHAVRETIIVEINCNEEIFIAKGTRTIARGWHVYYAPYVQLEEIELPNFKQDDKIKVKKIELLSKETQPPKRYTPASIIKELERRNLGTKATRSEIIDTLFKRGYIQGKVIEATNLGISTIETLEKYSPKIIDEELTRHFELEMEKIREKKQKKEKILGEAEEAITKIIDDFKKHEKEIGVELSKANRATQDEMAFLGICPVCKEGNLIMRKGKFGVFASCNRYPNCKTIFSLPKNAYVKPAKKNCDVCSYPKVFAIKRAMRPLEFCLNPKCPAKHVEGEAGAKAKAIAKGEIKKKCPLCKKGDIVLRSSIYGKFYGCSLYPKCKYTEKLENV